MFLFFFFSSRRRHTRFDCDWSSDVCSSDLAQAAVVAARRESETDPLLLFEEGSDLLGAGDLEDRKSTRLNSSHSQISYAVFCLKKKKTTGQPQTPARRAQTLTSSPHLPERP